MFLKIAAQAFEAGDFLKKTYLANTEFGILQIMNI